MSDEEDDIFKKKKPSKKQKQQQQQQEKEQEKGQLQGVKAKTIIYCGICKLPLEFCEYSKHPQECAAWLKTNHSDIYTQYYKEEKQEEKLEQQPQQVQQAVQKPKKQKKVKVKESEIVYIKVKQRQKHKYTTQIIGLEKHNIDIIQAQKKFSKKFGCGAHIEENTIIELQGDLSCEIEELLPKEYPQITEDMIEIKEK